VGEVIAKARVDTLDVRVVWSIVYWWELVEGSHFGSD